MPIVESTTLSRGSGIAAKLASPRASLRAVTRIGVACDPGREERELQDYLGEGFDLGRLQAYERTLAEEFAACGDEQRFYRSSRAYLYNLTAFAMTGTKLPYLEELVRRIPKGSRLLDYGCG